MIRGGRTYLTVTVSHRGIRAEATRRGIPWWAAEAQYESLASLQDTLARLAAEVPARCRGAAVILARPPAQLRTIPDLPPVNERDLGRLVAQQASRFFRKNGHPLATDAVWLRRRPHPLAQGVAVEEPVLDALTNGLRSAGIPIDRVTVEGSARSLALRSDGDRAQDDRDARRHRRWAMAGIAGVWLAVAGIWTMRLRLERAAVDRELAALAAPLAALGTARHDIDIADRTVSVLSSAASQRTQALRTLAALATALPDSAALTAFTWSSDSTGVLTGTAKRGADVLASLDRYRVAPNLRFEGPVIREALAGRSWDRFTIVFGRRALVGGTQ